MGSLFVNIISGPFSGNRARVLDYYKSGSDTRLLVLLPDFKKIKISVSEAEIITPEKPVVSNARHIGELSSKEVHNIDYYVAKQTPSDGRYKGTMVFSHKTGGEIEIKKDGKLVKSAPNDMYRRRD